MQKNSKVFLVSFHSISGALLLDKKLKKENVAAKLIPVPRSVSSSCGTALISAVENEDKILALIYSADYEEDELIKIEISLDEEIIKELNII